CGVTVRGIHKLEFRYVKLAVARDSFDLGGRPDKNWDDESGTGSLDRASKRGVIARMRHHRLCGRDALGRLDQAVVLGSAGLNRRANRPHERSVAFCMHRHDNSLSSNRLRISARSTLSFRAVRCPDVDLPQEIYDLP